tara:strand:- start:1442 stop:1729 length:288 start_codon:yes stop_codon:yes gene_type:complete
MTGLNEKKEIVTKTTEERRKYFEEQEKRRRAICLKAMDGHKIRYESTNEPGRFLKYLQKYGIPRWESLSQKCGNGNHHAKKMLEKTKCLVSNFSM